jgi:hypothetical protein
VTGCTGSVTGCTGSVTGCTGSVTGCTGSVTGCTGSVTGCTGSVTESVTVSVTTDSTLWMGLVWAFVGYAVFWAGQV